MPSHPSPEEEPSCLAGSPESGWRSPLWPSSLAPHASLRPTKHPRQKAKSHTVYQAFHGPDAVFGRKRALKIGTIPDGTSNTILAVETSDGVPWTKPGGLPFDRNKELPAFGKVYGKRPLAVLMDGETR